jgi:hypothetical protein
MNTRSSCGAIVHEVYSPKSHFDGYRSGGIGLVSRQTATSTHDPNAAVKKKSKSVYKLALIAGDREIDR